MEVVVVASWTSGCCLLVPPICFDEEVRALLAPAGTRSVGPSDIAPPLPIRREGRKVDAGSIVNL